MSTVPADNPLHVPSFEFNQSPSGDIWLQNTQPGGSLYYTQKYSGYRFGCVYSHGGIAYGIAASDNGDGKTWGFGTTENPAELNTPHSAYIYTYTYQNKTVYYSAITPSVSINNCASNVPINSNVDLDSYRREAAWLMVYGDYYGFTVTYDLVNAIGSDGNPAVIAPNAVITNCDFYTDDENGIFTFNSGSCWIDGTGFEGTPIQFVWEPETGHLKIGIVESDITVHVHAYGDPYGDLDGESEIQGGGSVGIPGLPGLTATSTGIIGLFSPSASQMQLLADYMWTDFGGAGSTTEDILKEVVQALKRLISNPLNYVIGLNIIPSQGLSVGGSQTVRFGFVSSNVQMPKLTNQYFTVDCGTLSFDPVCGDTFLDYAPYAKFSIYLPYIGVKEIDANDFVGHTIGVMYRGDVVTGGVTAYITKDGSVMYQYSGCCALNVPLSSDSWGETISAAVQIATAIVGGGVSGGAAGMAKEALKGAASVAANPSLLSPQVSHSGAVSGGAGCMGVQYPFVIREAVRFHSTDGFSSVSGYPSYYYRQLSEVSGYTKVLDVHLHYMSATQDEITEIESILKEGAIF